MSADTSLSYAKKIESMGLQEPQKLTANLHRRNTTHTVFSEDTLRDQFDEEAIKNQEKFINAGFSPKICSELVSSFTPDENKHKCKVLDVGCGNGYVGQYLSELGFHNIHGIECRRSKL